MNRSFKSFSATLLVVIALLGGCGSKPPGCADPQTIDTLKTMVIENTEKSLTSKTFADDPDGWMTKFFAGLKVQLTGVVSDGYKQEAKKQLCKGTLTITMLSGRTLERSVEYTTQKTEDQKDGFLLEVQEFTPFVAGTANEARKYFDANRWTGDWNGTYACSGVSGATDGPQGPYSLPVTMTVQGTEAKLERTTRGGGIEMLSGEFNSLSLNTPFGLSGEGQNSPEDKWNTSFSGVVNGKQLVAEGAIKVGRETLRQCKLNLTQGGPVIKQSSTPTPPLTAAHSNAGVTWRL